jgi:tRNA(fMet)-specific endonuclease VapC
MAVAAPARVVLDTSAYSHLRGGNQEVIEWLAAAAIVYLPAVVLGELHSGFLLGSRRAENELALRGFLEEPFVELFGVDGDVARRYGEVFAHLRRAGTPIPTNDVWIAATTLVSGGHLITFDGDFGRVPGLPHTVLP